jgi:hypothetical protein
MDIVTKLGLVLFLAGVGMLITGSLPRDKMEKVQTLLGGKAKYDHQPPLRLQLLIGGAAFLFIGLVMLGIIHPPALGTGQVDVPSRKTQGR